MKLGAVICFGILLLSNAASAQKTDICSGKFAKTDLCKVFEAQWPALDSTYHAVNRYTVNGLFITYLTADGKTNGLKCVYYANNLIEDMSKEFLTNKDEIYRFQCAPDLINQPDLPRVSGQISFDGQPWGHYYEGEFDSIHCEGTDTLALACQFKRLASYKDQEKPKDFNFTATYESLDGKPVSVTCTTDDFYFNRWNPPPGTARRAGNWKCDVGNGNAPELYTWMNRRFFKFERNDYVVSECENMEGPKGASVAVYSDWDYSHPFVCHTYIEYGGNWNYYGLHR